MAKNLYEDALETFSYDEMVDSLSGVGAETGRLELKSELSDRPKIAHLACAMANADGGIIAIGIDEPAGASPLKVHGQMDVSDAVRTALIATINARVYPPPPLDLYAYENGGDAFLIVRVGRSVVGPHEYIASDNYNLPIKRGSLTGRLTLAEIDALRSRSQNAYSESPLGQREPWVTLNQWGSGPDLMIGIVLAPAVFLGERRTLDVDDDRFFHDVAVDSAGTEGRLHREFKLKVMVDSSWLHTAVTPEPGTMGAPQPEQQIEISSDGTITVKFLEPESLDSPRMALYLAVLATAYVTAQQVYRAFGIGPRVNAHIVTRLSGVADQQKMAKYYNDFFSVDLASQPFADAFLAPTMRMMRAANQNSKRDVVRNDILQAFVDSEIPIADELQRRWLA